MFDLKPLAQSAAYDQAEEELKALTIMLWQKHFAFPASDVNVYGAPHLGSKDLILRSLKADGISNLNPTKLERGNARYLLLADRHKNQKRGVHFLRTFLKCVWGDDFNIEQLYQSKAEPYPTELKSQDEINEKGLNRNDYFLTSRLSIELGGDSNKPFPSDVAKNLRTVLPARLFVAEVFRQINVTTEIAYADNATIFSMSSSDIDTIIDELVYEEPGSLGDFGQVASIATLNMEA